MTVSVLAYAEADEEARRAICEKLDETLFVEAGAGTGKTQALVDRYVALVRAGRPVERIAAITFTEKAAAELGDRVRGELEALLAREPESASLRAAIAAPDRAQISTIHAFCLTLLRGFAADAVLDPAFEVQDEISAGRRFDERWRSHLEQLAAGPAAVAAINRVLTLGLTPWHLHQLAHELWLQAEAVPYVEELARDQEATAWPDFGALLAEIESLAPERAPPDDLLRQGIERLTGFVHRLEVAGEDREAVLASGAKVLKLSLGSLGRAGNWPGAPALGDVRLEAMRIVGLLNQTLADLRTEALKDLLPFIVSFVVADGRERARSGKLVFGDLILRVRDLLRDNLDARRRLRERFDAILVDEFQDTDPLQVEILLAFATDPASGRFEPGRLFFVGDPKQSIYRFRRADMAVYARTRGVAATAGALFPTLSLNRRSQAGVLDWVNAVFARLLGAGEVPSLQPPYSPIGAERSEIMAPGVGWFGGEVAAAAREVRRLEANEIADRCRAIVEDGWEVIDREARSRRRAEFRDIAVLLPTRLLLQPLERALSAAAIPYRVEGGSLVYATQTVRDLINCLTAIDDPSDEVAVVAALRSPAYACSDVDIARFKLGGGRFNYLAPGLDEADGVVATSLGSLSGFHEARHDGSLAGLVERFLADRRLVEIGVLDSGSRDAFRRARFVVEQARAFEGARPESLRAFVAWLEQRAASQFLDHEGSGLDEDEDAVRILTVHGAKGLEFPIVLLAGLGSRLPNQTATLGLDRVSGRASVAVGSKGSRTRFTAGPADELEAQERAHAVAERDRLLYVAATRARDHLVVSLYHRKGEREAAALRLIDAGARELAVELPAITSSRASARPALAGLTVNLPQIEEAEFEAERMRLVSRGRRQIVTSATALGHGVEGAEEKAERRDESEPWARGRAATKRGRAVHAALQSLPWDADGPTIEAVARAQAVAEAIPEQTARVTELVRSALSSPAAVRALKARRALREVPFALGVGAGAILEGFVDLVIDDGDGLEVVDWKTDAVAPEAVALRLKEYELQAGLYVLGLEAATGRRVSKVSYVFVAAGVERLPGEPAALAANAQARLSGIGVS